jgi:hypothetical protein
MTRSTNIYHDATRRYVVLKYSAQKNDSIDHSIKNVLVQFLRHVESLLDNFISTGETPVSSLERTKCPINRHGSSLINRFFHKMLRFKNWSILPNYRSSDIMGMQRTSIDICYVNTKYRNAEVCRTRTDPDPNSIICGSFRH